MATQNIIRYFDMFAGIGGFRAGLERAGGFACIGHCEIDRHADRAYRAIHNIEGNEVFYEDARTINPKEMPDFDLLCGGFPCQPFSVAGKRKGFGDEQGTLFFEIARLAREKRPPYLLLENVPGLLSHDKGRTFTAILDTLSKLRYHVEFQVLNSQDFGVPQSRRRVYIVGYLNPRCAGKILPFRSADTETPSTIIDDGSRDSQRLVHNRIKEAGEKRPTLASRNRHSVLMIKEATKSGYKLAYPGDSVDLSFADTNTRRGRVGKNIAHTVDTGSSQGVVMPDLRIRRLTPQECFRLQGFSETQIDKLLSVSSDTQAYKQAGNAVTVNVIYALGLRLKAAHAAAVAARAEKEAV